MVDDRRGAAVTTPTDDRQGAASSTPTSVVTHHFPLRDTEVRGTLDALMSSDRDYPRIRLPAEITEKIVEMGHNQEHREWIASVFQQLAQLPKCKTCVSVS